MILRARTRIACGCRTWWNRLFRGRRWRPPSL